MTEQLKSLEPKELRKLQEALSIVEKAYGLSDDDIDSFFTLVRKSKEVMARVDSNTEAIGSLKKALGNEGKAERSEKSQKLMEFFTRPAEGIKNDA